LPSRRNAGAAKRIHQRPVFRAWSLQTAPNLNVRYWRKADIGGEGSEQRIFDRKTLLLIVYFRENTLLAAK